MKRKPFALLLLLPDKLPKFTGEGAQCGEPLEVKIGKNAPEVKSLIKPMTGMMLKDGKNF